MKKILVLILFATIMACAYCEVISRKKVEWVGGHQESLYCGSSSCIWVNGGYELPYNLKYDFWAGRFCN